MITYHIQITRPLEMDIAKLQRKGVRLDDQALAQLANEDLSIALNRDEKLLFEPGYIKDGSRYHLAAQLACTSLTLPHSATWSDKWAPIEDLTRRFDRVLSALTDEEKRHEGHTRWSLKGLITGKPNLDTSYFRSSFDLYISDVDYGHGKIRTSNVGDGAATERKQRGDDLRDLTQRQIVDSLEFQSGRFVIIDTGQFEWYEDHIFCPKHSRDDYYTHCRHGDEPRSFALGEIDDNGRFLPINCHVTYHTAMETLKAQIDAETGLEAKSAFSA